MFRPWEPWLNKISYLQRYAQRHVQKHAQRHAQRHREITQILKLFKMFIPLI